MSKTKPKSKPPWNTRCRICGQLINEDEDYEVVRRGKWPTLFVHTACTEKERARR